MRNGAYKYNDNDRLMELQEEYLRTRSPAVWNEFFNLAYKVCKNITVSKILKTKRRFTQSEIDDYALEACVYVLRRYKGVGYSKKAFAPKNYRVTKNFITTFSLGVRHALAYTNTEKMNFNSAFNLDNFCNVSISDVEMIF